MFTRHKEFSAPGRREHQFEKHTDCQLQHCPICDGGLQFCTVCRQGEADLAAECPGPSSTVRPTDTPVVAEGMSILDAAFAKTRAVLTESNPHANSLYIVGHDATGKRVITHSRSTHDPRRDTHVMTSALELMQAIVLRDVPITPQDFYRLVVGRPAPPIDMVLHCPVCGMQHIDAPEPWCDGCTPDNCPGCKRWNNPPHRSHLCAGCGHVWRPADVPTNGVAAIKTHGKNDSPLPDAKGVGVGVKRDDFTAMQAAVNEAIRKTLRAAAALAEEKDYGGLGGVMAEDIRNLKI